MRKRSGRAISCPSFPRPQPRSAAYAVAEGKPHNVRIHKRGDPDSPGAAAPRRFLQVLGGQLVSSSGGSGRLQLADWLTEPRNPLTARVMVNRIWQGHFGVGLVKTPNDFGTRGTPPTHPELLDYLARRFVESGWSIKAMHRLIVRSAAYQRTSVHDEHNAARDHDNVCLWRFSPRRLSAEEIRDALLAVSGDLDPTPGGRASVPRSRRRGASRSTIPSSPSTITTRRSVYLMTQRIKRHPFLALFDGADTSSSTGVRYTTTVPTQALFFLNDPFVHARAAHLAQALLRMSNDRMRLERAAQLLLRPAGDGTRERIGGTLSGRTEGGQTRRRCRLGGLAACDVVQQRVPLRGLRNDAFSIRWLSFAPPFLAFGRGRFAADAGHSVRIARRGWRRSPPIRSRRGRRTSRRRPRASSSCS